MLNFSICDYKRKTPDIASRIIFKYFGVLDEKLSNEMVSNIILQSSKTSYSESCLCDFLAGTDEALLSLAHTFRSLSNGLDDAFHLTIWFLACNQNSEAIKKLYNIIKTSQHSARSSGGDAKISLNAVLSDWEAIRYNLVKETQHKRRELMQSRNGLEPDISDVFSNNDEEIEFNETPLAGFTAVINIGDETSSEGNNIKKRYGSLIGTPLPYKGEIGNISTIKNKLTRDFPWAENVVDYVCGQLALQEMVKKNSGRLMLPAILIEGSPGSGKTRFLDEMCKIINLPSVLISCGGTADSGGLLAVSRGWATSRPCGPVQAMVQKKCVNPAIILDEIDKGSKSETSGPNGNISGALLSMMSGGSDGYYDTCLMSEANLSAISFLATANETEQMPEALKDRFMIIKMDQPNESHFESIFEKIKSDERSRIGATDDEVPELNQLEIDCIQDNFLAKDGVSIRAMQRTYRSLLGRKCLQIKLKSQENEFENDTIEFVKSPLFS
jgi:glutaredoxin